MKRFFRTVFQVITVLTLLCFIPNLFVYKISPASFWPIGVLGIGFAYVYIVLIVCLLASLFLFKKWSALLMILLIAPIPILQNVFATGDASMVFSDAREDSSQLRIMQWNCQGLKGISEYFPADRLQRSKAVGFLQQYQPDIICIQDFGDTKGEGIQSNIALLADSLHYPYHIFSRHYFGPRPWGDTWTGIAIFSRIPIVDSGIIHYKGKEFPESILWVDLVKAGKKFRVGTTHFQSMYLHYDLGIETLDSCFWEDSSIIVNASFLKKLQHFQPYHVRQAETLRAFMDTCRMPFIFTGDLNSVPSSYVYKQVRGGLQDAFLEKGFGLGRTYHSWQPALRIDYIFHNDAIENKQTGLFRTTFSDHDPLLMDFEITYAQ